MYYISFTRAHLFGLALFSLDQFEKNIGFIQVTKARFSLEVLSTGPIYLFIVDILPSPVMEIFLLFTIISSKLYWEGPL